VDGNIKLGKSMQEIAGDLREGKSKNVLE